MDDTQASRNFLVPWTREERSRARQKVSDRRMREQEIIEEVFFGVTPRKKPVEGNDVTND